jgi:two-component system nitrogen regulation sensor histidine kinase NtrY
MGLGLAMIKNIIEAYDGTISFTSQVGIGTVFTVILPKI